MKGSKKMENEFVNNENFHQDDKRDVTKEKILLFIIGLLVGAVISTVAFFVCVKVLGVNSNTNTTSSQQMGGGTPPEMPSGDNSNQSGTPPEKPDGDNNSQGDTPPEPPSSDNDQNGQGGTPPEKPSDN